ncbi:MAG: 4Fe-4S dicluster domain-containing protein [Ruminococcaceae bacterium]|nr:4Fe-4S dicluster domain-containing protein [Oscillospiraceae bacterium]
MKKVGIVSLYNGQNFGNKLQNYAAEQLCLEYGFSPYTFKYEIVSKNAAENISTIKKLNPSYIKAFAKSFLINRCQIKNTDTGVISQFSYWYNNRGMLAKKFKIRENKYNSFDYKYLNFAQKIIPYNERDNAWTNEFAMFFAGSDQVWNPYYPFVAGNNFLQFAPEEKRASLSASFGVSEIPELRREDYSKWLNSFRFLSVREEAGQQIIKELTGRDSAVTADPTMLVDISAWDKLAKKPDFELPEKYLLTYFLGNRTKRYQKYINKLSKKYNLEIINLLDILSPEYLTCDPAEFVYCIKNAQMICTDSFHSTVFSILYKKAFVTFDRVEGKRSMGSRLNTLLGSLELQCRKFENINDDAINIDYTGIDDKLEKIKSKAKGYFDEVFKAADNNSAFVNTKFDIYNTNDCTGCMACVSACPTKALSSVLKDGFYYPELNNELCINCNKCEKICPVFNAKEAEKPQKAYAMRIKDNEEVMKLSSSGGVITAISNGFINGDSVYGAAFNDDFSVSHIRVRSNDELSKIRKAKYVQSSIADAFESIKSDLSSGKRVLFTGTPCQVAAVKRIVGNQDGFFTAGVVCHGVPSPQLWQEHLQKLEEEHKSKIISVDFRDKTTGWKAYYMTYCFESGEKLSVAPANDSYMNAFYHNKSLRPSCHNCHFKAGNCGADIIIGDFWGLNMLDNSLDDDKGMSVVTIHSEKGRELIKNNVEIVKEFDCVIAMGQNPSYYYSSNL